MYMMKGTRYMLLLFPSHTMDNSLILPLLDLLFSHVMTTKGSSAVKSVQFIYSFILFSMNLNV